MKQSFRDKGGWWVTLQFALMTAVTAAGPSFPGSWPGTWHQIAGSILVTAGAWIGIAGACTLGRNRTAYPVPKQHSVLIQHGIYGRIRHPLYTSLILLGLGWSLCWCSFATLFATLLMALQLQAKATFEESRLKKMFPDYDEYSRHVPRFFPRFPRPSRQRG